ncbi:hypothetical protein ASD30_00640 [Nocardioides sp. Root140]|nr:hypothetical protein ASD30_00640 [Nocardioides sp. Root140]KRF17492.1 hypothetical protein ASH02_24800 [Nocardioides sp. Soil796]
MSEVRNVSSDVGHGHGHGHSHAAMCGGLDHSAGDYTPQQQADLDLVLAFNRRMADAIKASLDTLETERYLDPDPLRYMWVDEGQGQIPRVIAKAGELLASAPQITGHTRHEVDVVEGSRHAARPTLATGADGASLTAWIEWIPDRGDIVRTVFRQAGGGTREDVVSAGIVDVFRPTAVIADDGAPWVFYGARVDGLVGVWATTMVGGSWTDPSLVSGAEQPAFNQEVVTDSLGRLHLVWQGRNEDRFGIFHRTLESGSWSPVDLVTDGVTANVWDPTVAAFDDGSTAHGWSEYRDGAYRVVVRRRDADGRLHETVDLTSGDDYALHPHLAVTADQQLWCAFDVITVSGHGGSGPTRLRPVDTLDSHPGQLDGMREPGDSVPPELLPEVAASIRVVNVADDGLRQPPGDLAPRLNVVPAGLPRLVPTDDGGLTVCYRIHRQLPLMTYYWEVASQALTAVGWSVPSTLNDTDGPLEEVSVAAVPGGAVMVAQTDARLERALQWTEGFGGRECPYLLEHHGSVIWHGIHGLGTVVTAQLAAGGPVPTAERLAELVPVRQVLVEDLRTEARRWVSGVPKERYVTSVGDRELTLYWGDLHRHSLVSRCTAGDEPSLEDFYRYAWDVCDYDFWAVTDHSENSSDYQWWSIQKIADLFHIPGRFVPLYGFEWTSADSGHQNVIFGDVERGAPIFSAFADGTTDPDGLWAALAEHPEFPAITIPHHPGAAMVNNDWDYHDPRFSRLVEVFQACRGNYESDGCFRQYADGTRQGTFALDGLKRGHKFGLIASSDHGHGASYVGAFSGSLQRADVFEALHERRTFAATTRDVLLDVRMGETFMGEEAPAGAERTFTIHAEGYTDLARIDIIRNGEVVHQVTPDLGLPDGWLTVPLRVEWGGADVTTTWSGSVQVTDGAVVQTSHVGPEVTAVTDTSLHWEAETRSFGEPYGAQRGGVEVTFVGPPTAVIRLGVQGRGATVELAALHATLAEGRAWEVPGGPGHLRLQPGVGGLASLGAREADLTWTDDFADDAFYYTRVFQTDGEMAWSSPIWALS